MTTNYFSPSWIIWMPKTSQPYVTWAITLKIVSIFYSISIGYQEGFPFSTWN